MIYIVVYHDEDSQFTWNKAVFLNRPEALQFVNDDRPNNGDWISHEIEVWDFEGNLVERA